MKSVKNLEDLKKYIATNDFKIISFRTKANRDIVYKKIDLYLKEVKGQKYFQAEKYTDTQVFHENFEISKLESFLENEIKNYRNINAKRDELTSDIKVSKKGKVLVVETHSKNEKLIEKNLSHNKEKNYIIKEGMDIIALKDLGIFTTDGKVVNSKYNKFKQINRFIEFIDDEIKNIDFSSRKKSVYDGKEFDFTVLDFGCGKSYLTFITYYYLKYIKKLNVKIIGLDLKEKVIENCNELAKKYGYENLSFEMGDINGYHKKGDIDMVISLHACDTATDYSIFNAINWNAEYIFSVPCCQHEFNRTISNDDYKVFTDFGIVKERIAALMTDSVRGKLLKALGYKTQLLEFIDIEHSPKNILIRAVKSEGECKIDMDEINSVKKTLKDFNVNSTLLELLKKEYGV